MNILVLGGTRYMGVHLVKYLLGNGHHVTIATRGNTVDHFGDSIKRIILERTNAVSIQKALHSQTFDVVYDSLAYCSNDVKYLLDTLKCSRYIQTSSLSVYTHYKENILEDDFNPHLYPLKWCTRDDYDYGEVKRQAECAIFQVYKDVPSVAVRFPYVIGKDDYTKRLYFYVEHVLNSVPMCIDNINEPMAFINSDEAGRFLAWLADHDFCGCINAGSYGSISLQQMIDYIENKSGKKAILSADGEKAPYNGTTKYSISLRKAENIGFTFSHIDAWIYGLLDEYMQLVTGAK